MYHDLINLPATLLKSANQIISPQKSINPSGYNDQERGNESRKRVQHNDQKPVSAA